MHRMGVELLRFPVGCLFMRRSFELLFPAANMTTVVFTEKTQ